MNIYMYTYAYIYICVVYTYINSSPHFLFSMSFICLLFCPVPHPPTILNHPCVSFSNFSHLFLYSFLSIRSPLLVTLSEFSVHCAAVFPSFLIYSFLFGINSPSYRLDSVTGARLSCRTRGKRGSFGETHPVRAPSHVKPPFLPPARAAPAAAPGKHRASYEQEAQGQLLILKTILICLCLISVMLMLAAPRLLTKLGDFLFNLACGLSGPKMKLTVQATFPW